MLLLTTDGFNMRILKPNATHNYGFEENDRVFRIENYFHLDSKPQNPIIRTCFKQIVLDFLSHSLIHFRQAVLAQNRSNKPGQLRKMEHLHI